jgi:rare lipoprotein A
MKFRRSLLLVTTALAGALLSGCMETTFAVNAAKTVARETPKQQGIYKVGDPYQINGVWYYPAEDYNYNETGVASFYGGETSGTNFHGKVTANGELYDMNSLTAAHQTLPMPSLVRVTNLENGRSLVLRVNDRGPFVRGRILDVSRRSAQLLGFEGKGTAKVRVQLLSEESQQLKFAMLQGTGTAGVETVAAAPRGAITSDTLAPPPGARSAGSVASAPLPPPSETLSQTRQVTTQQQRNGRTRTTTEPLARQAAPVTAPPTATPSSPVASVPAGTRAPVAGAPAAPVSREVAAQPVQEQARARPVVTQQSVRPSNLFVQAGAFANYDNAYRLSARLSRYGTTQVSEVQVGGQQLYRVRIGPVSTVQDADSILEWIADVAPQARIIAD